MNGFIRGGGGTPNGGTAVLEGGVRTLEDTMIVHNISVTRATLGLFTFCLNRKYEEISYFK